MWSLHPAAEMCGSGFDMRKGNWICYRGLVESLSMEELLHCVERMRGSNTAIQKRSILTPHSAMQRLSCMWEKLKNRQQDEY